MSGQEEEERKVPTGSTGGSTIHHSQQQQQKQQQQQNHQLHQLKLRLKMFHLSQEVELLFLPSGIKIVLI